ncbi:hypothetical protein XU18_0044 [Perkinsela sp. CCAP 1560/4]|nr:hypothetical protein XU18_0044 [Perkinsela sp. CCAP 1560/4]|eukprot:KNH09359.1 hypothetical protein XU18_0044 [Perkinsela sp. CCAP 1560/4]
MVPSKAFRSMLRCFILHGSKSKSIVPVPSSRPKTFNSTISTTLHFHSFAYLAELSRLLHMPSTLSRLNMKFKFCGESVDRSNLPIPSPADEMKTSADIVDDIESKATKENPSE